MRNVNKALPTLIAEQALMLNDEINTIYGTTAVNITRDSFAKTLMVVSEKGAFRGKLGNCVTQTFTAAVTDICTATAHGFYTGQGPIRLTTSGTLPAGLAAATDYWVNVIDANTFKLATTKANAEAGVAIDITNTGSGTHTIAGSMPAAALPAAGVSNGGAGFLIKDGERVAIAAPQNITFVGYGGDSALSYWWV